MDVNQTYFGNHFIVIAFMDVESLCWAPYTYTVLYVNYISVKLGGEEFTNSSKLGGYLI